MLLVVITLLFLVPFCHNHDHNKRPKLDGSEPGVLDKETIEDKEHIKEHLEEEGVAEEYYHNMTAEEAKFHFFTFHDTDNSSSLDGLEMMRSFLHSDFESHLSGKEPEHVVPPLTDEMLQMLTQQIDQMYLDYDKNDDGYIDYPEYMIARGAMESAPTSSQ